MANLLGFLQTEDKSSGKIDNCFINFALLFI